MLPSELPHLCFSFRANSAGSRRGTQKLGGALAMTWPLEPCSERGPDTWGGLLPKGLLRQLAEGVKGGAAMAWSKEAHHPAGWAGHLGRAGQGMLGELPPPGIVSGGRMLWRCRERVHFALLARGLLHPTQDCSPVRPRTPGPLSPCSRGSARALFLDKKGQKERCGSSGERLSGAGNEACACVGWEGGLHSFCFRFGCGQLGQHPRRERETEKTEKLSRARNTGRLAEMALPPLPLRPHPLHCQPLLTSELRKPLPLCPVTRNWHPNHL